MTTATNVSTLRELEGQVGETERKEREEDMQITKRFTEKQRSVLHYIMCALKINHIMHLGSDVHCIFAYL